MSSHLPSRWLFAAALLAAGVPTSAAVAQSPEPLNDPPARLAPQTAPVPLPIQIVPTRLYVEPLLLEEEQVSEHGDRPHAAPLIMPAPRVLRACGLPECDEDEDRMAPGEVALRCLLFSINPLAAFLPMRLEAHTETLPSPTYMQNTGPVLGALGTAGKITMAPPQYIPPTSYFPLTGEVSVAKQEPDLVVKPQEVERLEVMPIEVEQLEVMPVEEESEPEYQLLAPWIDYTRWFKIPTWPLAELKVSVKEPETGSVLFGVGAEVSLSGTIAVTTEPPVGPQSAPAPEAPGEKDVLPQPRQITDVGPRTEALGAAQRVFGQPPVPTRFDLDKYKHISGGVDDFTFTFEVIVGHTRLLHLKETPARIQIGDKRVFDYTTLDLPTELLLQGASVGSTSMFIWSGDRNEPANQTMTSFQINVLPEPHVKGCHQEDVYKALQDEINQAFPDSYVHLALVGDELLVGGEVKDATEAKRVVEEILTRGNSACEKNIINRLVVPQVTPVPQVQLNMLVAEVKGKAARKLNLDHPADGTAPRWMIEVSDEARQKTLDASLTGLREKGHAKVVAEPRLQTLSGQQASFLSGGEQAVPEINGLGQASVRYEEFGTRVTCQPLVMADGTIRLEVEPEISEFCDITGVSAQGRIVPGRSSQRVHTTANIPPGHTLVISGPKTGGDTRLVIFVTPTVIETPAAAAPTEIPNPVFDFGSTAPQRRIMVQMNQSEKSGPIDYEELRRSDIENYRTWMVDQPSHLTPERVNGGVKGEETVHDLLVKCQRELSRGHYASAEDLAQKAIERDRKQVAADPLVLESDLLQRVKAIASLPLGTVDPCAAKGGGGGIVSAGAAKAIGSDERIVEVLLQEFNTALNEARYHDANALAQRACDLDPENAMAAAALQMARSQGPRMVFRTSSTTPALPVVCLAPGGDNTGAVVGTAGALARFQGNFKEGRYEEAKADALRALAVAPGNSVAVAALQQACEALARQPRPEPVPQCTYVGTNVRPILPSVDPAVVGALQKLLIEGDKGGSFGGVEEAEPKDDNSKPMPRR